MTKFTIANWQEREVSIGNNNKSLIRSATIKKRYTGVLQGDSVTHYSLYYFNERHALFSGLETFTGQYQNLAGQFVLHHEGHFKHAEANASLTILPGSGTEQLRSITGTAYFIAGHQKEHELHIKFTI